MEKNIFKNFTKYVSLNILGMMGLSCYILADTFFISKALGATGIAALNFSISIYSVIHATGLMIGIGGSTRYSILKSQNDDNKSNVIYSTSIKLGVFMGIVFGLVGLLASKPLALLLGANMSTLPLTNTYLTTILCFSPFFILNNVLLAFVRNDNNPNLSMIAMLTGSFSNVLLDYIFMFPLGMGMFGAAFATGLAPIISILIMSTHFIKGKNNFTIVKSEIKWTSILDIVSLGLSAFITEVSSAVSLITFNLVILKLKGNIGVASYGIVANIALVVTSIFTGIAQGIQPIVSKEHGLNNHLAIDKIMDYALFTSLSLASIIYLIIFYNANDIILIFNSEGNSEIAQIAIRGLRIYFLGFFFAGTNIIKAMCLSAKEKTNDAFLISIARGCIIIIPLVLLLSNILNMTGVWLAFVLTESIVAIMTYAIINSKKREDNAEMVKASIPSEID